MKAPHVLKWVAADAFVSDKVLAVPSILRFAKDDFMEQMLRTLAQRPQALPDLVAGSETDWQHQAGSPPALPDGQLTGTSRAARMLARRSALQGFRSARHPVQTLPSQAPSIKLFQPVHQRYYLAAAHLVCELPGLPPRLSGAGDRSGFVLRQVVKGVEHGFVKGEDGQGRWVPAADPGRDLVRRGPADAQDIEELLPLFPMTYAPPAGPARTLMAGLVPVARRDEYAFAPRLPAGAPAAPLPLPSAAERWKALAMSQVIEPWQALINVARQAGRSASADKSLSNDPPWDKTKTPDAAASLLPALRRANLQLIEGSWRVQQGLREWVDAALPDLADAINASAPPAGAAARRLYDMLGTLTWGDATAFAGLRTLIVPAGSTQIDRLLLPPTRDQFGAASLRHALRRIDAFSADLDKQEAAFALPAAAPWPDFGFPLALASNAPADADTPYSAVQPAWPGVSFTAIAESQLSSDPLVRTRQLQFNSWSEQYDNRLVALLVAIDAALDEAGARLGTAAAQAPAAAELAQRLAGQDQLGPVTYVLRFVHLRCDCGPVAVPVLSEPSVPLELAGFFDADAPIRPIRIALPFDTTPGGLRKYGKNTAFVISDLLCGQMKRVRKLGFGDLVLSVLPWPFHKDLNVADEGGCNVGGNSFGMICSLSIPIITIVAFVLLIVIAALLDLIFRWLPFLMVCFPVPGLKGKK